MENPDSSPQLYGPTAPRNHQNRRHGSMATSLRSQEIIEVMHAETGTIRIILGICRGEILTDTGKRVQLLKILSLTLLPILGLWAFTVYSLSDSIEGKSDIEQTQYAVQFSVEIGKFLDRIQRERDMSVLYLSILGPETKTFLMNEYLLTDQAVDQLSDWPENNEFSGIFRSKDTFKKFLKDHRNQLDPSNYDIYVEMDFYNFLIGRFVEWMYGAIKESNQASIWKILVAYQKIVTSMEHVGIERSLGTVFYVEGGFPNQLIYERYNNRVNNFKANYRSAVLYSHIVDPIFQEGVTATGTNLTAVIEKFRYEMQSFMHTNASIERGQWWFDNMTLYLDTLLIIQQDLANLINGELQNIIDAEEENLIISACFLVIVFLMCPLVIYTVEALTSDIQKYALALVHKTKELSREKKKTDSLLYLMVPRQVAEAMKERRDVDAEYYKSVTILFSEIFDFMRVSAILSPVEIVALLDALRTAIDAIVDNHEVYKVETINDCYMVASGLPNRIGNRHSAEVANLALDLIDMVKKENLALTAGGKPIELRIGINTGACMAGIVGIIQPRYCLFGDTVNTASRLKAYGLRNRVHISSSTHRSLQKHAVYIMQERGTINVKGKGKMTTYWLTGRADKDNFTPGAFDPAEVDPLQDNSEVPGEIHPYKSFSDTLSRYFAVPTSHMHPRPEDAADMTLNDYNDIPSTMLPFIISNDPTTTATPYNDSSGDKKSSGQAGSSEGQGQVQFLGKEDVRESQVNDHDDHSSADAQRPRSPWMERVKKTGETCENTGPAQPDGLQVHSKVTLLKQSSITLEKEAEAQIREEGHYELPDDHAQ